MYLACRSTSLSVIRLVCQFALVHTLFADFGVAQAQTPTLDKLKDALAQERLANLPGAQAIYQALVNDSEWGVAAHLGLARVQRWQNLHELAISNYEVVLSSPQASQGMRDEANLGLSQIDAQEFRLKQAWDRLNVIGPNSPIADQVREMQARVESSHPTRFGANYGRVLSKGGSADTSWQIKVTHQLDFRNSLGLSYSSNSLQQRAITPDATLDFVKGQLQGSWRYGSAGGVTYSLELSLRQLKLGSREHSVRGQGNWPINKQWRANAGLQTVGVSGASSASGFAGLSTAVNKQLQLGGNVYAGETPGGTLYSGMANATYENGPWLAQYFVSRSRDTSSVNHTVILRQRLSSGVSWRTELRNERSGNTAIFGLDIPWGRHSASTSFQTSPGIRQWGLGFDYAVPNGLPPNNPIRP
jgi:hypothetical protein